MNDFRILIQCLKDVDNIEKNCYSQLLGILNTFSEIREKEEDKLPPQFNIISAIVEGKGKKRLPETGHSRVLCNLLKDKHIQNSFLDTFFERHVIQGYMEVELEKDHIDVYLRNDEYAIIIENKINNADDGEKQLLGYAKTVNKDYSKDSIFVLYISDDGHAPQEKSIRDDEEDIYDFIHPKDGLLTLSYPKDILPWLKGYLADIQKQKQYDTKLISSALIQYIDYLEDLFQISTRYEPMNKELDKYLINKLGLEYLPANEALEILENQIDNIDKLKERLADLKDEYIDKQDKEYFRQWYKDSISKIGDEVTITKISDYEFGFRFKFRRTLFDCVIAREDDENKYYWGIFGVNSDIDSKRKTFMDLQDYVLNSNKGFTNYNDNPPQYVVSDYAEPNDIVERFTTLALLICDNEECILV